MKQVLASLAVLLLCACGQGAADFSGHWVGSLSDNVTCSDGSGGPLTEHDDFVASKSGSVITLAGNGACGVITADASGDVASFRSKACTPVVTSTSTSTETLTGGTATINGSQLAVNITFTVAVSGSSGTGSCTGSGSGTLTKQ